MPYTQVSNYGGSQLPPSLYFGTDTGDPGGGSIGKKKAGKKKAAKKDPAKPKKKR